MGNRCCKRSNNDAPQDDGEGANPFKRKNRKCTDLLFMLLFLAFWVGMIVIAAVGYKHGQPKRLVYGTDWMGRTCGVKADSTSAVPAYDLRKYEYLLYPRLAEDVLAIEASGESITDASVLKKLFGVCVSECPMVNASTGALYVHAYKDYATYTYPVNTVPLSMGSSIENVAAGSPWRLMMNTTTVFYRCVELTTVQTTMTARCADDCSADEEAYFTAANITTRTCGSNTTLNPFVDCGESDCGDMILKVRSNCTTVETSKYEMQLSQAQDDPVTSLLSSKWQLVARWIGDIQKSAFPILICGGLFAMVLGFFWLILLRFFAGLFVWLAIILAAAMLIVITVFCAFEGSLLDNTRLNEAMKSMGISASTATTLSASATTFINTSGYTVSQSQVHYWAIACYVLIAVDLLMLLLLIFMCSRIRIAIGIIREASKALQTMPMLTLYPIVPTVFATALVAYWLVAAAYIATSASITLNDVTSTASSVMGTNVTATVSNDSVVNYLLIYHLFGLLWTSQFIQAVTYTTIAGAFCEYYWTLDKRQVPALPVLRSYWRTLRYHFGSMAFGSLIIAIVQFMRIALEYIDQKMKSTKQGNKIVKLTMLCLKCCLWCFEKCMKFLNNNAFIMIAMKGRSFCPSMKDSFGLLLSNAMRVATVSIISRLLMVMGKCFISAFCMFFMFLFIRHPPTSLPSFFLGDLKDVSSPIFPMLLTGLLGYTVASFFLDVYGTGIDTILLCFCEDCNVNKGSDKYYMSDELFAYIDGPAKKNAFRVYQPNRDVSVTAPPIYQSSPLQHKPQ